MANGFARRGIPAGKKAMALVLQGGGALGAHEWGAIVRLCEAGFYPIAVTGVSIGAVNAAAIAGAKDGDIITSLNELWRRLTLTAPPFVPDFVAGAISAFGHPAMYRLRRDFHNFWSWTAFCEMAPLYKTLTSLCDFDQINDENHMGFAVTATDVGSGTPGASSISTPNGSRPTTSSPAGRCRRAFRWHWSTAGRTGTVAFLIIPQWRQCLSCSRPGARRMCRSLSSSYFPATRSSLCRRICSSSRTG